MSTTIGDTGAVPRSPGDREPFFAELPPLDARPGVAVRELARSLDRKRQETENLARITTKINEGLLLDEILGSVFEGFSGIIPYNRIGFSLIEEDGRTVVSRWARSDLSDMKLLVGFEAPLSGSSLLGILETGRPRIINDLEAYLAGKPDSLSTRLIVSEGMRSSLTCPLTVSGEPVGFMFFSSSLPHQYRSDHVSVFKSIAAQLSVIVEKGRMASELDASKQEAERQNVELRRLDAIKNRFLGMVAHDLRNPIADIQMSAELLGDPATSLDADEQNAFLSDITRQAGYMVSLIDDLLDLTKIESGRLDLHWESLDVGEFLEETVLRHAKLAARKGTTVTMASREHGVMQADRKRLRQVLDNLISNAVKFSPAGSSVRVRHHHAGGSWRVEVMDQGPGLTESDHQRMFDDYARLSAKPTGGEQSTGLGMAITRRAVEAHGGEIGVDSQPGIGSTFWFTIPDAAP